MNLSPLTRPWPWAVALLLATMVVAHFLPALTESRLLGPTDGIAYYFPVRLLAAAAVKAGEVPFWNPYVFSGTPFLAAIQPGVFFPGNWPFLVLPPYWANNVTVMGTVWAAGLGAYAFARALALPRLSSLVPAMIFMTGGFFTLHVAHLTMIQAAALLPWMLWAVERFTRSGRTGFAVIGCWILAFQILAGHPQMVAYSALLVGAYGLWRALASPKEGRRRLLCQLGLLFGLGIGLSLLQLLPTLDLIGMSQRKIITFERLTYASVPPLSLSILLFPYVFGSLSLSSWLTTPFWGDGHTMAGMLEGYAGLGAILLGLLALFRWRREPQVRFWALAAATALVLAMGKYTPLYQLWAQLPVVKMMPYASRHLMVFTLAIGMLAACGLAGLERRAGGVTGRALAMSLGTIGLALGGVLLLVALFGPGYAAKVQPLLPPSRGVDMAAAMHLSNPGWWIPVVIWLGLAMAMVGMYKAPGPCWRIGLLVLLVGDLYLYGQHQQLQSSEAPASMAYEPQLDWSRGRTVTIRQALYAYPYATAWGPAEYTFAAALQAPNLTMLSGIPTVGGYDAFVLDRYGRLMGMGSEGDISDLNRGLWKVESHVLDILGLKTLYFEEGVNERLFWRRYLALDERWRWVGQDHGLARFENVRALPRAWRVERASVLSAGEVDRRVLEDPTFAPRYEALLEEAPSREVWAPGSASAKNVSLNRIAVQTEGDGPGLVLVSESYDPGWRAFSAGGELAVQRADALIMAVEVPSGKQEIELRYEPRLWRLGLLGSSLALGLILVWAGWGYRRLRRHE